MKRVLVADDNPVSRELIREILEDDDCEVIEAGDGREALEKTRERRPDLALLDIQMPVMDGNSVLREIRADPQLSKLPVVALTAFAMQGDREKALAVGFNSYITKPIDIPAFRAAVAELLENAPSKPNSMAQSKSHFKLVAIDDTPESLELITEALSEDPIQIFTNSDPEEGLEMVFHERPQIVLLDLVMPKLSGMEVLERIVEFDPGIEVILMTAHYSTESAVEAIKKGASDYLNKPISITMLRERVRKLMETARQRQRSHELDNEVLSASQFEGMVGRSPVMWDLFARIRRVAPHFRTVLLTGATGTGKELAARALHQLSPVSSGRYVVCNCSAVVETLFESELFGYVKGAFTGANQDKMGLFEYAHNGTLFLDEIGDMPMNTQAKLLRVLQNQEVQRVGSLSPRKVDARVIAATNHDLKTLISQNRFREDLYYRLSMVEIRTPRLAERKEDLALLEHYFVRKFAEQYQKPIQGLTQRAQIVLARYSWPGNVRELENVLGSACMMVMSEMIDVADLPENMRPSGLDAPAAVAAGTGPEPDRDLSLEEQERLLLMSALERSGGNQSQAARLLRISRDRMRYKMSKHNLK